MSQISLKLTREQALVFYEWLARQNTRSEAEFEDQSEQRVLWDLECMLEQVLDEPFVASYSELLEKARTAVRDQGETARRRNTRILSIGTCSCGQGCVGVRVPASGRLVVGMCDECDAVWTDCELRNGPYFPTQPDLPCPGDGSSLRLAPAHWANRREVAAAGWAHAVLGETDSRP
jgi:hypothetical protein